MDIKVSAYIFVLLYTAYCNAADPNDFDGDYDMQNDNENYADGANYEEADEGVEESKMPEEPVEITTKGEEFTRSIGETVVLPCVITGSSFVRLWRRTNSHVKDAVLFQSTMGVAATPNMRLLANGSLELSNLHIQDAGRYECTATVSTANSPKIEHNLVLRAPPLIESLEAKDNMTLLRSGDTLILTCKASGYPKPVISWHKGSSRFDIQGETLKIEKVKHHDAGTYKCLADNKVGEPAFTYINIKVEFKPFITVEKIVVSSENNTQTELECVVHAEPRAQVVWFKDGQEIKENDRFHLANNEKKHNLILKDLKDSDFGTYTCEATNPLGTAKKNISVVPTPAIDRFVKTQTENKILLTWDVQSKSNLSAQELSYRKKGDKDWSMVPPDVTLDVTPLENGISEVKYTFHKGLDPGEYQLKFRAQNPKGWSADNLENIVVNVYTKHGHHKNHKKGHTKHGKEKQATPTPTLPPEPEVPEEHQESANQSGFVKESASATKTSGSSITTPTLLTVSISLFPLFQRLSPRI